MRTRLALAASLALSLIAPAARSADPPGRALAVTIYADDLALIQDRRDIDVKGGRQRIEFQDVSAQIRPETVSLKAADIAIVEQNFDFDLLTPAKLMEKAVGHEVTIVRVNPGTGAETREQAEVLATNGGVVLKIGERIEVLRDDGLPVRVIFDKVPDNLRARPTLSVTITGGHPGTRPAALSYLTPGLGWRADYVALYDENDSKIDVQGWVTLTNSSGTTYENAQTLLVAGYATARGDAARGRTGSVAHAASRHDPAGRNGERQPRAARRLLPVSARRAHHHRQSADQAGELPRRAWRARRARLRVSERLAGDVQHARQRQERLPLLDQCARRARRSAAGRVLRFYMRDKRGDPQFIGESAIEHTPMGSTLSLATGDAFDVKVHTIVVKRTKNSDRDWQTDMSYELSNAMTHPVTVDLLQAGLWGESRIIAESQKSTRRSADTAEWQVTVPASGKTVVTASFDTKF